MIRIQSSGHVYRTLLLIFIFLALTVCGVILARGNLIPFFMTQPWLNGSIVAIMLLGFALSFRELGRLVVEARRMDSLTDTLADPEYEVPPESALEGLGGGLVRDRCLNVLTVMKRAAASGSEAAGVLSDADVESEEGRAAIVRYLIGVMIFLGLIGTFWGLLITVGGVKEVLQALEPARVDDATTFIANLKTSIGGLLGGMSTAFSTSLFGLSGSVLLGFVEVKTRQARSRFLADLDRFVVSDWLPRVYRETVPEAAGGPAAPAPGPDRERFHHLAIQETFGENLRRLVNVIERQSSRDEKLVGSLVEMKTLLERLREEEIQTRDAMLTANQVRRDLLDRMESQARHTERLLTEMRKTRESAGDSAKAIQERLSTEVKIAGSTISGGFSELAEKLDAVLKSASTHREPDKGGE
jgi:hypothetical protein